MDSKVGRVRSLERPTGGAAPAVSLLRSSWTPSPSARIRSIHRSRAGPGSCPMISRWDTDRDRLSLRSKSVRSSCGDQRDAMLENGCNVERETPSCFAQAASALPPRPSRRPVAARTSNARRYALSASATRNSAAARIASVRSSCKSVGKPQALSPQRATLPSFRFPIVLTRP
jgi:hypothetical protein